MTTITALVRLSPSQGNRIFHSTEDESEVLFIKKNTQGHNLGNTELEEHPKPAVVEV